MRDVPGEVRPLVDEVNDLMQRLGKTLDFQNRFIADAAHQLKTPVTGLKAQIELALRENDRGAGAAFAGPAVRERRPPVAAGAPAAVAGAQRAGRDRGGASCSTLDLERLALEVSHGLGAARRSSATSTSASRPPPARCRSTANRTACASCINNLIDNAVRYSQPGRPCHGGGAAWPPTGDGRLSISDDGPDDPGRRSASASSSASTACWARHADGSGLGLAIVSEIATLHGARITLEEDIDGVGNTFSVFFPPAGAAHARRRAAVSLAEQPADKRC